MRTEWRIVCDGHARVFTDRDRAKEFVRTLLTMPHAVPSDFDAKPLQPTTFTITVNVMVLRTDYMDDEFEVAT